MSQNQREMATRAQVVVDKMQQNAKEDGISLADYTSKLVAFLTILAEEQQEQIEALQERARRLEASRAS